VGDDVLYKAARDADLLASGLSKPSTIKRLGLGPPMGFEQIRELTGLDDVQATGYEIPYFDVSGKPLKYSRWKILPIVGESPFKYYQEPKTIPHVYLPPLTDWMRISRDVGCRVVLTEGEKKAACATLMGMPTIGLGGVWNWKSKGWSMETLKDFDWFEWQNREVEICYDGDMYSNADVSRALGALCVAMSSKGARVFVRHLPSVEGKSGLDDFLVAHGLDAYRKLECPEDEGTAELHALNEDLVYVKGMTSYYSMVERIFYPTLIRLSMRYGDRRMTGPSGKRVRTVDYWTEWPQRRMVDAITYEPGRDAVVDGKLNSWTPGVTPKRGRVSHVLEVLSGIGDQKFQDWLIQWLAYPVVHQGAKLFTAVLVWSTEQGTGKTFLGKIMCQIYGQNSATITGVDLHDERYGWLRGRQFILAEEVTQAGRRSDSGLIKHLITGDTIRINEKYIPAYSLPNKANIYFTSNAPDAIRLDKDDRRMGIGEVSTRRPDKFWEEMDEWVRGGGAASFAWHLKNKVTLRGFKSNARAPESFAKETMIYTSMSAIEQWAMDLIADPESVLPREVTRAAPNKDVFAVADLLVCVPEETARMSGGVTSLGRALAKIGAVRAGPVRTDGGVRRLVAIRNLDYWRENIGNSAAWSANYAGKMAVGKRRRKK
jgi:hypothetical protein